jgi:hypothetical protein
MPQEDKSPLITGSSDAPVADRRDRPDLGGGRLITSAVLIGTGVLVEPELLGGALLGAGVVYGLPLIGRILRPVMTAAVRLGYSTAAAVADMVAGTRQELQGIIADARSGYQQSGRSSI